MSLLSCKWNNGGGGGGCSVTTVLTMAMVTWCLLVATPMTGMVHGFVVPTGTTTAPRLSSIVTPKTQKTTTTTTTTRTTTTTTSTSTTALYGIPKMFRWLTDQYPDIVNRQLEQGLSEDLQVENFYLDMNGIIHPCTHGNVEGEFVILDETAMFKKIFLYVDRLYKLVRPTRVLYLAVDGVAPRAKMNQQRSRRFRSAKEAEITASELVAQGKDAPGQRRFDSNCITPGTDFMLKLSLAMQKWVEFKMETDEFWKDGADVIVSGPDVPGEGEHKVMDFIRECQETVVGKGRSLERPHYAPDYTHVLYGLDADLIMLGLVTHEPRFLLLREKMSVVMAGRGRHKYRKKKDMLQYDENDFEILDLSGLREMLSRQFRQFMDAGRLEDKFDLDRIIDDFVFMCMLVGNDFLPRCPHLEIDSGGISLMMSNYIDMLTEWGGYLTKKEKIHPQRLEQFIYNLAAYEEEYFKRRGYEEAEPGWKLPADAEEEEDDFYGTFYGGRPTPKAAAGANRKGNPEPEPEDLPMAPSGNRAFRRKHPDNYCRSYRDFYYETKLGWKPQDRSRTLYRRRAHAREYMEGLHWCLNYYHRGCKSWDWFFPYFYSPLATDLVNLSEFYDAPDDEGFCTMEFDVGEPFPSLAQLLSVLPPQSSSLLPKPFAELMINPASPLLPYYPPDFTSDPNGKRESWEAIVQIPFIEADLLLGTVEQILEADDKAQNLLSNGERRRNMRGTEHLFIAPGSDGGGDDDDSDVGRKPKRDAADVAREVVSSGARVMPTGPPKRRGRPPKARPQK